MINSKDYYLFNFGGFGKRKRSGWKWMAAVVSCLLLMQMVMAGAVFGAPTGDNGSDAGSSPSGTAADELKKGAFAPAVAESISDPTLMWMKTYGGSSNDVLFDIKPAIGGGYIAVGESSSTDGDLHGNKGSGDFVIVKFDERGNVGWIKNYGGSRVDRLTGIILASDGGYIAAGWSSSTDGDLPVNKGESDFVIAKFNENGEKIWLKTYGGGASDYLIGISATPDGGYILAGHSGSNDGDFSENYGDEDYALIKVDANGEKVWAKNYGGSSQDWIYGITPTPDGGCVVLGDSYSTDGDLSGLNPGLRGGKMVIARFDANGEKVWLNQYNGDSGRNEFRSATPALGGGYIAVGCSTSTNGEIPAVIGVRDIIIAKFDEYGNKVWHKNYGGSVEQNLLYVGQAPGGGYIAAGCSMSDDGDLSRNYGGNDAVFARFDENGNKEWIKSFGGSERDEYLAVVPSHDQRYIAVGLTHSSDGDIAENKGESDFLLTEVRDPSLLSIAMETRPQKVIYEEGETLDLTGLDLFALFDDNTSRQVTDYTTNPPLGTALTAADTKVTILWRGKTTEYPILVNKAMPIEPKLTVSATEGGSILRLPLFNLGLKEGTNITVYAFPASGYRLSSWETTGIYYANAVQNAPAQAQSPLKFTMPAGEVTVKAVFEKITLCKITASSSGLGFLLGAPSTAYEGTTITMMAVPLWPFSRLDHWEVNGISAGTSLILNHTVTGDATIKAVFK